MACYPSYVTVFRLVKGTPKSAPPLTFLTNAEIPDALIQKGLRRPVWLNISQACEIPDALIQKGLRLLGFGFFKHRQEIPDALIQKGLRQSSARPSCYRRADTRCPDLVPFSVFDLNRIRCAD